MGFDAYRARDFLAKQSFVDPKRAFVVGFSQGGLLSLSSAERGSIERIGVNKFLAAAAFYPVCIGVKGPMTVSTLILIGESDDWTPAEDCRKLAAGQNDFGISRQKGEGPPIQLIVYPAPTMHSTSRRSAGRSTISDITSSSISRSRTNRAKRSINSSSL
jgi:dienelactone hydrolase